MRRYTLYTIFLLAVLFTACTTELPFDIKANPPKLVMNALMNADSLTNYVFLNLTGKDQSTNITHARVEVRINGELTETLRPMTNYGDNLQCKFLVTSHFHRGDEVRVDAYTDDGQYHAWAEVTVPQPIDKIDHIDTVSVAMKSSFGTTLSYLKLKIKISDRKNERNFYRLIVENQTMLTSNLQGNYDYRYFSYQNLITREDVVLTDGNPSTEDDEQNGLFGSPKNLYNVFSDSRFKNSSYTFTVYSPNFSIDYPLKVHQKTDVAVRILSIPETEYYYLKALDFASSDLFDPVVSEPIRFPSNVHGGTGIVSISSETGEIIHIIDQDFELDPIVRSR